MNGPGRGTVGKINRPLGIGTIDSEEGPVLFTPEAVRGGQKGFDDLSQGQSVKYRKYPAKIGDADFAEDVWPSDD